MAAVLGPSRLRVVCSAMQASLQGMHSFVASNMMPVDPNQASINDETWGRYPDDKPVRPFSPQPDNE